MNDNAARILARRLLRRNVVIFTGAGMSTASGIPDFRSAEHGLWRKHDPQQIATPNAMRKNYANFRSFFQTQIRTLADVHPNIGHTIIASWEKLGYVSGVITQNVDRLHTRAGTTNIAEIHGTFESITCISCGKPATVHQFLNSERCPCGGNLRPAVVLFGEDLPEPELDRAWQMAATCETFVAMGSSLRVFPAADIPRQVRAAGAFLVIVNNERTPIDRMADLVVRQSVCEFLTAVETELAELRKD
jgi:NAD-dependent deacetylase